MVIPEQPGRFIFLHQIVAVRQSKPSIDPAPGCARSLRSAPVLSKISGWIARDRDRRTGFSELHPLSPAAPAPALPAAIADRGDG
jgi:hypothetical protein